MLVRSSPLVAFILVSIAACATREPQTVAPSAEPVVFVKAAPRVGSVAIEEHSIEFRLDSEAKGEGRLASRVHTESVQIERRRDEVLAVFDRIVTKKKVTYEKIERAETRNGKRTVDVPSLLVGRSYVAEVRLSVPVFTTPAGAPVSDAEEKELGRRLVSLGKPDPFLESIPNGPVYPGWPAPRVASGFLELFESGEEPSREGPDIGKVDVRYAGMRDDAQGRCGVFAFTLAVQMAGEPRLTLDLKGELWVRASDSAPVRLDARGPAHLEGIETVEGVSVKMSGSGEMTAAMRITYL